MADIKVACNELLWLPVEYLSFPVATCYCDAASEQS
jgi:hypothetical protein